MVIPVLGSSAFVKFFTPVEEYGPQISKRCGASCRRPDKYLTKNVMNDLVVFLPKRKCFTSSGFRTGRRIFRQAADARKGTFHSFQDLAHHIFLWLMAKNIAATMTALSCHHFPSNQFFTMISRCFLKSPDGWQYLLMGCRLPLCAPPSRSLAVLSAAENGIKTQGTFLRKERLLIQVQNTCFLSPYKPKERIP